MQNEGLKSHDKTCNAYMKFCVNVTQKFVGNKLQLFHTNFCVTYTQMFLQCTLASAHLISRHNDKYIDVLENLIYCIAIYVGSLLYSYPSVVIYNGL